MKYLILAFLIFTQFILLGQDPSIYNYSVDHGLPSNEVYHVMQDSKGYIWFCTDKGVSRYNGYSFENYTTDDGLTDNTVFFSYEDKKGRIWFLSFSPLLSFYNGQEICQYQFNDSIKNKNLDLSPKVSFQVSGDKIYVGTNSLGGYSIDEKGKVTVYFNQPGTESGLNVIISDTLNMIYKISDYLGKSNAADKLIVNDEVFRFDRNQPLIARLIEIENAVLFSDGTNLFQYKDAMINHLVSTEKIISSLYYADNKQLFVSTLKGGVDVFEINDDSVIKIKSLFTSKLISWVTEDREGGMWFTTLKEGVLYHSPNSGIHRPFYNILPNKAVLDIAFDNEKTMYISYSNGSIWKIIDDEASIIEKGRNDEYKSLSNPIVWNNRSDQLISTSAVNTWFYKNKDEVIAYFERAGNTNYPDDLVIMPLIKTLDVDSNSNVYVGTNRGSYIFHEEKLLSILNSSSDLDIKTNGFLRNHKIDALLLGKKEVYISALNGLSKLVGHAFESLGHQNELFNSRIDDLFLTRSGMLLLGSRGNGLIVVSGDSIFNINSKMGLNSNLIHSISEDQDGDIWIGTNKGLNRITFFKKNIEIKDISLSRSLPSNYLNKIVVVNNQLWIGSIKGLRVFDLKEFDVNSSIPQLSINKVYVNDSSLSLDKIHKLNYDQNTLSFYFTGISFARGGNINYEYKLSGTDSEWKTTKSREVRYNSLSNGNYTFLVRASNENGNWSEASTFSFEISPPFYLRWYFIVISSLSVVGIIFLFFYRREKNITEIAEFKQRSAQLELKALRAQMNPHFTFNTLSSIQQYILKNDSVKANDYLSQFANLIRRVLENSRNPRIKLSDELESLENYLLLEQLRFPNKIEYKIDIRGDIDAESITVPPALIQPFVENAIVHGIAHKKGTGHIEILLTEDSNCLVCTISDDGIGRKKSMEINAKSKRQKSSLGMQITKDRLDLLKDVNNSNYSFNISDMQDEDGIGKGTKVEIFISNKY